MFNSRNASVLYIDNPVGAGFSYTMDEQGYPKFVNQSSEDLYEALQQFFTIFSDFAERWQFCSADCILHVTHATAAALSLYKVNSIYSDKFLSVSLIQVVHISSST